MEDSLQNQAGRYVLKPGDEDGDHGTGEDGEGQDWGIATGGNAAEPSHAVLPTPLETVILRRVELFGG